jgi:hypothetical protein
MASSGMLRSVALVRTDVPEELSASFIRMGNIGEIGIILTVTSNGRTLARNYFILFYLFLLLISSQRASFASYSCVIPSSPILVPVEGGSNFLRNFGSYNSHTALTSQKTPFFIITAVKTSNLTQH